MSPSTITLLLLVFAMAMFLWNKLPVGVTAMLMPIALILFGDRKSVV